MDERNSKKLSVLNVVALTLAILQIAGGVFVGASFIIISNHPYINCTKRHLGILSLGILEMIMLFALSAIGMVSAFRRNQILLLLYTLLSIINMGVFISIISMIYHNQATTSTGISNTCNYIYSDSWAYNMSRAYSDAYDTFCTNECPCNLTIQLTQPELLPQNIIKQMNGLNQVQGCIGYHQQEDVAEFLKSLENKYNCSGFCDQRSIYYFSDINRGEPTDSCTNMIVRYISDMMKFIKITSFLLMGLNAIAGAIGISQLILLGEKNSCMYQSLEYIKSD